MSQLMVQDNIGNRIGGDGEGGLIRTPNEIQGI